MKAALRALLISGIILALRAPVFAQAPAAAAATPTLEQRMATMEAYLANTDPHPGMGTAYHAGPAYNGWMMTAALLVLFMTLPGLALSYAGLVRRKNVLSVLAQCLGIAGMVTIIWWAVGYSLVFAPGKPWLGGLQFAMLKGVGPAPNPSYSFWVSQNIFTTFELMFAIITPAIIVGATAERMRFASVMSFVFLWMFAVYFPVAHMMWGVDGLMNGIGNAKAAVRAIDFAGGTVVHMTSGWSALVICMLLGRRHNYGKEKMPPHSIVLCMIGTAMLWVGWYGFNSGSALGADDVASNAFLNTTLAAAVGASVWGLAEWIAQGKSSTLGFCSGAIGGLVITSPSCGYVTSSGAMILGVVGGILPFFAVIKMKNLLGYDDALDAFGVHAINGTVGILLTGFFARTDVNPRLAVNLSGLVGHTLWLQQVIAIVIVMAISIVGTLVAGTIVNLFIGLRVPQESEYLGLDLTEHGEEGYIL